MKRRFAKRLSGATLVALLVAVVLLGAGPVVAVAAAGPGAGVTEVPVLIVDGGLGDAPTFIELWLGTAAQVSATRSGTPLRLWTADPAAWWSGGKPPLTYVLAATDDRGAALKGVVRVADVAWALDRMAAAQPRARAMIVAQGAAGLVVRRYLQDLGWPRQSGRADVAGLLLLGCPNAGLPLLARFPQLDLWTSFARPAGLSPGDLAPGSAYLTKLNAAGARLPRPCRVAVVQGTAALLAGEGSDGIAELARLPGTVLGSRPSYLMVDSSASDALPLAEAWRTQTVAGGADADLVPPSAVKALESVQGYAASATIRQAAQDLYVTWFPGSAPSTHLSTRLVIDTSGSMAQAWSGTTKIDAARAAARDFVAAYLSGRSVAEAPPEDLGLITFADRARIAVWPRGAPTSIAAKLARLRPEGDTDVGAALRLALRSLGDAPRAADKAIVLLSDGVNTAGLDQRGILNGPVRDAQRMGVRIETIALGSLAQADEGFLARIAKETGGTYSRSGDLLSLRTDFLRAKLSALGQMATDSRVSVSSGMPPVAVARISQAARRLDVVVIPSGKPVRWRLTIDGRPVPARSGVTADGVVWFALSHPEPGSYTLERVGSGAGADVRVLAAADIDAFAAAGDPTAAKASMSAAAAGGGFPWLITLALVGVAACIVTVFVSRRSPGRPVDGERLGGGPVGAGSGAVGR